MESFPLSLQIQTPHLLGFVSEVCTVVFGRWDAVWKVNGTITVAGMQVKNLVAQGGTSFYISVLSFCANVEVPVRADCFWEGSDGEWLHPNFPKLRMVDSGTGVEGGGWKVTDRKVEEMSFHSLRWCSVIRKRLQEAEASLSPGQGSCHKHGSYLLQRQSPHLPSSVLNSTGPVWHTHPNTAWSHRCWPNIPYQTCLWGEAQTLGESHHVILEGGLMLWSAYKNFGKNHRFKNGHRKEEILATAL